MLGVRSDLVKADVTALGGPKQLVEGALERCAGTAANFSTRWVGFREQCDNL